MTGTAVNTTGTAVGHSVKGTPGGPEHGGPEHGDAQHSDPEHGDVQHGGPEKGNAQHGHTKVPAVSCSA